MRRISLKGFTIFSVAVFATVMNFMPVFADTDYVSSVETEVADVQVSDTEELSVETDSDEEINTEVNSLKLYGGAVVLDDTTIRYTINKKWLSGSAWCTNKISTQNDFTVTFKYWAGLRDTYYGGADGFVLNMTKEPGLGVDGGDIGFLRGAGNYGVELDSYQNTIYNDPYKKHVAVIEGSLSNHIVSASEPRVDDSNWHDCKVEYLHTSKTLKVYIDDGQVLECGDVILPDNGVYLGITSATGDGFNVQKTSHFAIDGVECKIQPANIVLEDAREINGSGHAFANFILKDEYGDPLKNTTITYKFEGDNQVRTAKSTDDGKCCIFWSTEANDEIHSTTSSSKKLNKVAKLYMGSSTNKDVSELTDLGYTITMDVIINPVSFSQSWEASSAVSVTGSIGESAGIKVGPLEAKASVAEAEASGSAGVTMAIEHEYSEGQRNLKLSETFVPQIGINGSVGPVFKAEAISEELEVSPVQFSAGVTRGLKLGYGTNIKNYNPGRSEDRKKIGRFILGAEALSSGNIALLQLAELLGFDIYNTTEAGATVAMEAGASFMGAKFGDVAEGSVASVKGATNFELTGEIDESENTFTANMDRESNFSGELGNFDVTWDDSKAITGGEGSLASKTWLDHKYGIETVYDNSNRVVNEVKISGLEEYTDQGKFLKNTATEKDVEVTYEGDEISKLCADVPSINRFVKGKPLFLFDSSFKDAWKMAEKSKAIGSYEKTRTDSTTYAASLGLGLELELGLEAGLDVAGTSEVSYAKETGKFKNGIATQYSTSFPDADIDANKLTLFEIVTEPIAAIANEAKDFIKSAVGKIGDLIEQGRAKLESKYNEARDWTIKLIEIGVENCVNRVLSVNAYSEDGIEENGEGVANGSANVVGKPYIVTVIDNKTNEPVKDFGEEPLTLTIGYSEELLEAAKAKECEDKLAIYRYNETYCGYVFVGGTVDKEAKEVKVDIYTPGQYIICVDVTAPVVKEFSVSDSSSKPTLFVTMDEGSDFNEFSMKLDGKEIISSSNWFSFYETQIKRFSYRCIKDLSIGKHTVVIEAMDSAGNRMEPQTFEFSVDEEAPEEIHAGLSESPKGEVKPNDFNKNKKEENKPVEEARKALVVKQKLDISDRLPAEKCSISVSPRGVGTVSRGVFTAKKPCTEPIVITAFKKVKGKKVILKEITLDEIIVKPVVTKTITRYNTGDTISANDIFSAGTPKVTEWVSNNASIVEVNKETGILTVKENERARATKVTAFIGNVKYVVTVKIRIPVAAKLTVKNGKTKNLVIKNLTIPKVLTRKPSAYRIEDTSIATVDEKGSVTGKAVGTTKIYVTVDGVEYPCTVKVTK